MDTVFTNAGKLIAGTLLGTLIGAVFGAVQQYAKRRLERKNLSTGWAVMPGSMTRVAFLLAALLLVQVCFPVLFEQNVPWAVSIGVAAGYGAILFAGLRRELSVKRKE